MRVRNIPFNITLLDANKKTFLGLFPVQAMEIRDVEGNFHPQGLYSNVIFGEQGSKERNIKFGYIHLKAKVLHPKIYDELHRLNRTYTGILHGTQYAVWDKRKRDFVKTDVLEGETGYAFFMQHWDELVFPKSKSHKRDLRIQLIKKYKNLAPMEYLAVLPAGLRDITTDENGRDIEEPINKLYRKFLIYANGIPSNLIGKNDPMLDRARSLLQKNLQELYALLMSLLEGKRGFLQNKWASRTVMHSTRNVISSVDHGGDDINSPRSLDAQTIMVGLYQTIKSLEPILVNHHMLNGLAKDLIANIDIEVSLINKKTLKAEKVILSERERTAWGTADGRAGLIGRLSERLNRNKPVIIDGRYFKLVYEDNKGIRVLNSISELPEDKDPNLVRPLLWSEYFYLEAFPLMDTIRTTFTRYPVTSMNSIQPAKVYLKTTVNGKMVNVYDTEWNLTKDPIYPEWPERDKEAPFFDSVGLHYSHLEAINGDMDGDNSIYIC